METEIGKLADDVTPEKAAIALDSMDDFARMDVGVDPIGPRGVLERFIEKANRVFVEHKRLQAENEALKESGKEVARLLEHKKILIEALIDCKGFTTWQDKQIDEILENTR